MSNANRTYCCKKFVSFVKMGFPEGLCLLRYNFLRKWTLHSKGERKGSNRGHTETRPSRVTDMNDFVKTFSLSFHLTLE